MQDLQHLLVKDEQGVERFADYRVTQFLGAGGMGIVFACL